MCINQKEEDTFSNLLLKSTIDDINEEIWNQSFSFINNSFSENEIIDKNNQNLINENESSQKSNYIISKNNTLTLQNFDIKNFNQTYEFSLNEINLLISNLKGHFFHLMMGKNSNYFISNLIINAAKKQKLYILSEIYNQIDILAINDYGSHPLQTLIEKASSKDEIIMIINGITAKNKLIEISKNQNGTYVIQKIISYFNENFRTKINKIILNNLFELCVDMYGVCIIQKFINNCYNMEYIYFLLISFINNMEYISKNQFGNYAIQILIDKIYSYENIFFVLEKHIFVNFIGLSIDRYGSRVIEKYIDKIKKTQKRKILSYLIDKGYIFHILVNKYGKYVISKLLHGFNSENRKNILNTLSSIKKSEKYI